jgi:hypothetical protein
MEYARNTTKSSWLRRWIAILLSSAMVLSYMPVTASAATAPSDGSLDFTAWATAAGYIGKDSTTLSAVNLTVLNDDNTSTHPGDFYTPNNYFTLDFGDGYGVTATQIKMQARASQTSRLTNGRVLASMDGTVWTEITTSKAAGNITSLQTLDVAENHQSVPYRYLRIMADGSGNIFNIGELRIVGERVQLADLLHTVSISSDHSEDSTMAMAGDTVTVSFVSAEPISNAKVIVNGKTYDAQSTDLTSWSASYVVSPYELSGPVPFAITYTDTNGEYGKTAATTTDGSSVSIIETSDYMDMRSKAEAFGIPTLDPGIVDYGTTNLVNGASFADKIMDQNMRTYSNWNGPKNDGYAHLVIDLGEENAVSLDRVYILARPDQAARLSGTYLQGSNDGIDWNTVSSNAMGIADWQTLSISDKSTYRYLKITNNSKWYLNMTEIKFYGKIRQAGVLFPDGLQGQVAAAQAIIDKGQQNYTDTTWQALEQAWTDGKAALGNLDNGNVTQEDLDALSSVLADAINGLKQEVRVIRAVSPEGIVHPGIGGVTSDVLENIRTQINNKQEPWYSYYTAMLETDYAKTDFTMSNSLDGVNVRQNNYDAANVKDMASRDGQRAFTQALLYFITGNETYRSNAMRIIRIWGQMDPTKYKYFTDSHIHTGPPLHSMIMAAEILRYTSSSEELRWTDEDTETFTKNVVDPAVKTFLDFNDKFMNQHNYPLYGSIAAYIFKNDRANYNKAIEWLTVNDSAPDKYMTGSIYWLFREMTQNDETGEPVEPHVQHVEMGRDLAHGEGDVVNFITLARMVDAQGTKVDPVSGTVSETGVSIYEFLNDRILMGADYYAKNAEGLDITWTPVKTSVASEFAKDKIYTIASDEYKGRMHYLGAGGMDLYYVYRYKLGYSEEELEAKAPYFVKAFKSRVSPNYYFSGEGSAADVSRIETGADWWIYVPKEVADEPIDSIARTVRKNALQEERYLLQLDEAYSIIDGSNQLKESTPNIRTQSEGDVSFIRTIASDNQTMFAAYRIMFIGRNGVSNVGLKFRTNGLAKLEIKKDKDSIPFQTLELPDTQGEWKFVTFDMGQNSVSYGQFPSKTFMAYFNVVGSGTQVDIDYMDIKADNSLTPPAFKNITRKSMSLTLFAGSTIQYDFSAVDKNSSDSISYHLQGDDLPGAALDPATGIFTWTPAVHQAGSYQSLVVASDGTSLSTVSLTIHVASDRMSAISNVISAFNKDTAYEMTSLEILEGVHEKVLGMAATATDSEFYAALDELTRAVAGLKLLNPLLSDGSLDFTQSSIRSSLQSGYEAYLVDNNTVTFSGDLTAKYFTMDFGPSFRVAPTAFALQPRNIWAERMSGAIIFGSNDGDTWEQLTDEAAYSNLLQRMDVRAEQLGKVYRYFKVSSLESTDYYANKNSILSVGEFRIFGERSEIPTRISTVSISTDAATMTQHMQGSGASSNTQVPVKKAVAGNTLTLNITAKQPLTQLQATIAGMEATVIKLDELNYTATVALSPEAARRNASKHATIHIAYKYLDAKNNLIETDGIPLVDTTDGSAVLVSDVSRRIDDVLNKAVLTFNKSTDIGTDIGPRLFDYNTNTFVDIRNVSSAGDGVFYLFDFGAGAVSLSSVEVAPRMTTNLSSRMIGIYAAGSNDGVNFTPISSQTKSSWDWQGLTVTDSTYYRYIQIVNRSSWFGNLSELEFFGSYVADRSTIVYPPVVQSAVPGDGKVTLTWSAVPEAVSYSVYASPISGAYNAPVQTVSGDVYSLEVNGLTNGTTYYFTVSASTEHGTSELSKEVTTVPTAIDVPAVSTELSSLELSDGIWTPVFHPEVTSYSVSVTNAVYSISVTASVYDPRTKLKINGVLTESGVPTTIILNPGSNPITVMVSGDTATTTYHLNVIREEGDSPKSSIADLTSLVLSAGQLTPAFSSGVTKYSAMVDYHVSRISVTAAVYDSKSSLTINGVAAASGITGSIALKVGNNPVLIMVTAEDGTVKEYDINVIREDEPVVEPDPDPDTGSDSSSGAIDAGTEAAVNGGSLVAKKSPDGDGRLTVQVKDSDLQAVLKQPDNRRIIIDVQASSEPAGVTVQLPADALLEGLASDAVDFIDFRMGLAKITISAEWLTEQIGEMGAKLLKLSVSSMNNDKLPVGAKSRIGDNPVYDLLLQADERLISQFESKKAVAVEFDYAVKDSEHPDKIVAYYVDENGSLQVMKDSKYDPNTGKLIFYPEHFSSYTVLEALVSFDDLETVPWAENAILHLAAREIIDGMSEGHYQPNEAVTRAQFVKLLTETLQIEAKTREAGFTDTVKGAWYEEAVAAAKQAGIIQGHDDGRFGVNEPISRQDIAVMTHRALQYVNASLQKDTSTSYMDEDEISVYAKQAVSQLTQAGLINGLSKGKFEPHEAATRAQAAVIMYRMIQTVDN